ncbi:CDP-glycerol glycerophosphotransferase [Agromyces flavus]|uniref:CDP-glycerol glycerophosphotransferase n=1 Tax=Agromyces flavus TaxID=589382 RepID=A0ABT1KMV3_9MICO|nr:glycosyltransferase family 2 protein [Agromyces flavus]MCP2368228.1 CDP-glycerol glycerophosphotransferase [Agromyces flavus]
MAERTSGWISVVMPVHDVADYVDASIRSVLSQGYWRLELIVVDDASEDATRDRVRRWVERDSRVRLVDASFGDVNAARNLGVSHGKGEYLAFLDGDDLMLAGALRDLVEALQASGSDFAVGSYDRLVDGRRTPPAFWIDEAHETDRRRTSVVQFAQIMVNAVQWTKVYRRSFWDSAGLAFPEGGHFQDQLVSARAYARAERIDVLRRAVVSWRIRHDGSSMTQQGVNTAQIRDRFATAVRALEVLSRESTPEVCEARRAQFLGYDAAVATAELPRMSHDAYAALRSGLASLAPEANEPVWNVVPAEYKVLFDLILRDDHERALQYIARGGLDLLQHDLVEIDGVQYVQMPYWGDEAAGVPLVRFRAAPRELRAFAAASVS